MLFFAYHRRSRPTGRAVAKACGFSNHGTEIASRPDFLVRWGTARQPEYDRAGRTINPASGINKAGDKLRALQLLSKAGIPVPEFATTLPSGGAVVWLGRNKHGFGGKDIQVIVPDGPVPKAEWYSRYIDNDREYRIHVCGGHVIRVVRKYLERPDHRKNVYVKNHANGYVFKTPLKRLNKSREQVALKAVEALGLDFGAVDLIVDSKGHEYVLEVNTAPACSPKTLHTYAAGIAELVKERSGDEYILQPQVSDGAIGRMVHDVR